jgi:hypothetical protein
MHGPANEAGLREFLERSAERFGGVGLGGVRRDNFQVVPLTKSKQSIACAAAGMHATEHGTHSGFLLDESHAFVEIVAPQKNVIEQSGHLIPSPRQSWRRNHCSRHHQKHTA